MALVLNDMKLKHGSLTFVLLLLLLLLVVLLVLLVFFLAKHPSAINPTGPHTSTKGT